MSFCSATCALICSKMSSGADGGLEDVSGSEEGPGEAVGMGGV